MTWIALSRTGVCLGVSTSLALALGACTPPHPHRDRDHANIKAISSLDCPQDEDSFSLKSEASDDKSCLYRNDAGDQVSLQLVPVSNGDVKAALAPLETQLRAELPAADAGSGTSAGPGEGRVDIDLPGIHIHANGSDKNDKGDQGSVQINAGSAQKAGEAASGKAGVSINASDKGAQISVTEAGAGLRQRFMLASDTPGPNGYKLVAYEARGPASGPLAVAMVMVKSDERDDATDAARSLLRRNVGG